MSSFWEGTLRSLEETCKDFKQFMFNESLSSYLNKTLSQLLQHLFCCTLNVYPCMTTIIHSTLCHRFRFYTLYVIKFYKKALGSWLGCLQDANGENSFLMVIGNLFIPSCTRSVLHTHVVYWICCPN